MMNNDLPPSANPSTPNPLLLADLREIIRQGQLQATAAVNSALTLTYWHVGQRIHTEVLKGERAAYGQQVIASLSESLVAQHGKSFEAKNLRRMMQFAEVFSDLEIVVPLARQLSWSHFLLLIPLPSQESRLFYAQQSADHLWGKRELTRQIERKAFERAHIADNKLALAEAPELAGSFKDPYFFDFLNLPQGYLENDLEQALICELELYLNWLDKYERQPDEAAPIGLILCAQAGTEQVELMNLQKDNIMVAQYWTELPPKAVLEAKLHTAVIEIRERLAEQKRIEKS